MGSMGEPRERLRERMLGRWAATSQENSAENPFPVRAVAIRVASWIDKLGTVWVEGQLAQISMRPDAKTVFMVLRDPAADMSLNLPYLDSVLFVLGISRDDIAEAAQ